MGENSGISWTDNTFNPWRGCVKVSEACRFCYAESMSHRNPAVLGEWGPGSRRVMAAESYWRKPLKWDAEAEALGVRFKVFCLSLGDVFEDRDDLIAPRTRLFSLIEQTPHLDWLLLTKRPEVAFQWALVMRSAGREWPRHAWIGATVERQAEAEERIPWLLKVPAAVRFLSCEPLLDFIDLAPWLWEQQIGESGAWTGFYDDDRPLGGLHWVIAGGESGASARPSKLDWFTRLWGQSAGAGIPFFLKQTGRVLGLELGDTHPKGATVSTWPHHLRVQEFPAVSP